MTTNKNEKSLEELEGNYWPDLDEYPSGLIKRCHNFRKIPIGELSSYQMATLIAQDIGIKFLLEKAVELLEIDILDDGNLYEGFLLEKVMKITPFKLGMQKPLIKRLHAALEKQKDLYTEQFSEERFRELKAGIEQLIK